MRMRTARTNEFNRRARHASTALMFLVATVVALSGTTSSADVTGDGLDEIGVFGRETGGPARGPWMQLFDGTGRRISSFFLGQDWVELQVEKIDTNGDGLDELVVLGRRTGGEVLLQVRTAGGSLLATAATAEPGATDLELFEVEADGVAPVEIGIGYTRPRALAPGAVVDPLAPWPAGHAQLWRRTALPDAGLARSAAFEAIPVGAADHDWLVTAAPGGRQLLVAAYSRAASLPDGEPTPYGAVARIFRPSTGSLVTEIDAAGNSFDSVQWVVGDFVTAKPGDELLAGLRRRVDGVGVARVLDVSGLSPVPQLAELDATSPTATEISWRAIRRGRAATLPGQPPAPIRHNILAGYRQANRDWAFRVVRAATMAPPTGEEPTAGINAALLAGGGVVLPGDAVVNDWIVGEFDGITTNGDSVVVLHTRADRAIGFDHWTQNGRTRLLSARLFEPTFIEPEATAVEAVRKGREDLAVVARTVSLAPRLKLWNVGDAGQQLVAQTVLGPDVR